MILLMKIRRGSI